MLAGRLNRRLTIQQPVETQSLSGEIITTFADVTTVWAEQLPLNGSEFFTQEQIVARRSSTFRIRYSKALFEQMTAKYRVVLDGRSYDVTDIREPLQRQELEIDCFASGSDAPVANP